MLHFSVTTKLERTRSGGMNIRIFAKHVPFV